MTNKNEKSKTVTFSTNADVAYFLQVCKSEKCVNVSKLITSLLENHMKSKGVL